MSSFFDIRKIAGDFLDGGATSDATEKKTPADVFPVKPYDRTTRNIWLALVILALVLWLIASARPTWYLILFATLTTAGAVIWLYLSVTRWSKDYEYDKDGYLDPGPTYKYSILGGRATDEFVNADNHMRRCLLASKKLPETANPNNFSWECIELDASHFVFRFTICNVFGAYSILKDLTPKLACEFGSPEGATFTKEDDTHYLMTLQRLGDTALSAGVDWQPADRFNAQKGGEN